MTQTCGLPLASHYLAAELGISFEDWQRIVKLLMKPPPKRVGGQVVLNSVAIGRAIVVDAAIEFSGKRNIVDLIELIKWRNGTPPASTKRKATPKAKAPAKKRARAAAASSDEEDSGDDEACLEGKLEIERAVSGGVVVGTDI